MACLVGGGVGGSKCRLWATAYGVKESITLEALSGDSNNQLSLQMKIVCFPILKKNMASGAALTAFLTFQLACNAVYDRTPAGESRESTGFVSTVQACCPIWKAMHNVLECCVDKLAVKQNILSPRPSSGHFASNGFLAARR